MVSLTTLPVYFILYMCSCHCIKTLEIVVFIALSFVQNTKYEYATLTESTIKLMQVIDFCPADFRSWKKKMP